MNLKAHWRSPKMHEIRISVNIHWVFLGLKEVSILYPIKKRCEICLCFAWLCIVFKLTSKVYSNFGNLLKVSFCDTQKFFIFYQAFYRLLRPEVTWTIQKQFKCDFFFVGFISLSSGTHHNIAFIAHAVERYCFGWFCLKLRS